MRNIIWGKPDGSIAITTLTTACKDKSQSHAEKLLSDGAIPGDWVLKAVNKSVPADRTNRDAWIFDGENVVING